MARFWQIKTTNHWIAKVGLHSSTTRDFNITVENDIQRVPKV